MVDFAIGNRVEAITRLSQYISPGDTGTVCEIYDYQNVGVEWDMYIPNGHSCGRNCKSGYGWYALKKHIKLLEEETEDIDETSFLNTISLRGGKL